MVNVDDAPVQVMPALVNVGVTVIVAVTGVLPAFTAVNDGTVPVPLAPRPVAMLSFTQLKVGLLVPVKFTLMGCPEQTVCAGGGVTVGALLMVMSNVMV